ncbi:MFS general substrate transporter [Amylocystis lapponica]|nr:MFS general substrate transporter [Amylocystis lapponica]
MAVGVFLVAMDSTIVTSTYATIGSEFEQLQSTTWIMTGYMITMTSLQPLYGKLSDVFGRKTCLICAYYVFASGCLLCGLAGSMNQLIAARAFAGIGGGGFCSLSAIVLTDIVPMRQRGTWQGLSSLTFFTGQGIGAPLGGLFTDKFGWRWAFIAQVPLTVLAIISVSVALKLPDQDRSSFKRKLKRVDFPGAAVLIIAVFTLLLGLDSGSNVSWDNRVTLGSLASSAALLLIFLLVETHATEPIIPKRVVVDRSMFMIYVASLTLLGVGHCLPYHVSLYLQAIQGLSPTQVGLMLFPVAIGGATGSLLAGFSIQLTGRYYAVTIAGFAVSTAGVVLVAGTTGPWPYSVAAICTGEALACSLHPAVGAANANFVALVSHAGPELQAVATAVLWTSRSLGSVVVLSLGTAIAQNTLRRRLYERLSGADVDEIVAHVRESLSYLGTLEPAVRDVVVQSYQDGIQVTLWWLVAVAALSVVASAFVKEKTIPR